MGGTKSPDATTSDPTNQSLKRSTCCSEINLPSIRWMFQKEPSSAQRKVPMEIVRQMKDDRLKGGTRGKQYNLSDAVNLESRVSSCMPGLGRCTQRVNTASREIDLCTCTLSPGCGVGSSTADRGLIGSRRRIVPVACAMCTVRAIKMRWHSRVHGELQPCSSSSPSSRKVKEGKAESWGAL